MKIVPYTSLRTISEFLPESDTLNWLSTTTGNVETRKLRDEVVLEARDSYEYENYLADLAEREHWDEYSRGPVLDYESESDENAELDRIRAPRYRVAYLPYDTEDPCDHNYSLWRRWAGDD